MTQPAVAPTLPAPKRLAFVASDRPEAQAARARLIERYGGVSESEAEVVIALGGDGFMLETLHRNLGSQRPIYGMNQGSVGFLMNEYSEDGLLDRINAAEKSAVDEVRMIAAEIATTAARDVITTDLTAGAASALVDRAITGLPAALAPRRAA